MHVQTVGRFVKKQFRESETIVIEITEQKLRKLRGKKNESLRQRLETRIKQFKR